MTHWDDTGWLDRLVDGELAAGQRRELLLALENHPEGWRRCALAFLEAQSWQRDLADLREFESLQVEPTELAKPVLAEPVQTAPQVPLASRMGWLRSGSTSTPFLMAASFLLAFGLGLAARSFSFGTDVGVDANLVGGGANSDTAAALAGTNDSGSQAPAWRNARIRLVGEDDGTVEEVILPVREQGSWDDPWLAQSSVITPDVRAALERQGNQVRQGQTLVPMQMDDGRQVVFPVEELEIVPVSARSY